MSARRRVLFVTRDASRTGAPIVLLHLLRWLRANSDLQIEVLLHLGGPLKSDFASIGPVYVLDELIGDGPQPSIVSRVLQRIGTVPDRSATDGWMPVRVEHPLRRLLESRQRRAVEQRMRALGGWDGVYLNGVWSSSALGWIPGDAPVITSVHELLSEPKVEDFVAKATDGYQELIRRSRMFIAVSEATRRAAIDRLGVPAERFAVCREFVPATDGKVDPRMVGRIRNNLEIPPGAFVIGGSGTLEWRKGSELFIQLAMSARRLGLTDRVRFVWVGADRTRVSVLEHLVDIERAGLTGIVHLVEPQHDPRPYQQLFDVFACTSRSDPFPLVCLEAAAAETPIVCFQDSGGMPEFVADGCGFVVPYADVDAMMQRIAELMEDPSLRHRLGQRAAQKVRAENDVSVVAPRVLAIIENCIADRLASSPV